MTNREALLSITAALRNLATALECDVQTEAEALIVGTGIMLPVQTLVAEVQRVLDRAEEHRRQQQRSKLD